MIQSRLMSRNDAEEGSCRNVNERLLVTNKLGISLRGCLTFSTEDVGRMANNPSISNVEVRALYMHKETGLVCILINYSTKGTVVPVGVHSDIPKK